MSGYNAFVSWRLISFIICASLAVAVAAPAAVFAQAATPPPQTRAELLRRSRDEKEKSLTAYQMNGLERALNTVETRVLPMFGRDGVHPKFGSLATGSGFAFGVGYLNRRLVDREGALNIWGAMSLKKYWAVEGSFDMPSLAGGWLTLGTYARHQDYPQQDFFGVGPDSSRDEHTAFKIVNSMAGGRVGVKPDPKFTIGGGLEYFRHDLAPGRNKEIPSIEALFTDATAPGLVDTRNFLRPYLTLEYDYRQPKNARKGGWYRMEASRFADPTDAFTFNRVDVDLRQYGSILAERRVLAVRLAASTSEPASGARVPFYLMPTLGGHDSLRGFRDYRFRGPHAILTQAEYRFEIWSGFDAALFYDAGKVTLRRSDLNFKDLEHDYGFGFRFNTDNGTILRIDAGFGSSDGKHLYIVFGDVF
jgi:outer membrane protein assembly factor BamA